MTSTRVQKYKDHIETLCREQGVSRGNHSRGGRAWRRKRHIDIREVKSAITYAVALHELGHILGPRQSGVRIEKELGAWEWAVDNALEWTPVMARKAVRSLESYLAWARRHKTARELEPGSAFFQFLDEQREIGKR